ncbi:siderophore-interacting protein [Streptomyces sp. OF3]|uniref:Siderophore-interacting protein n=1 Tax=Streptomyces alkaliterrae TaxID=2213162 RepID=A0A7W3WPR2_9ACTN|nr:siderophore-interacting protein [Streptomyces alkaliterrae]MBB1256040.1 siderophore-interacting protein [Streptomyces alkaliterrae]
MTTDNTATTGADEPSTPFRFFDARVLRVRRLSPSLTRVTFGGPGLDGFRSGGNDQSFSLFLPPPGRAVPDVPGRDGDGWFHAWRAQDPADRAIMRSYTIRAQRAGAGEDELTELLRVTLRERRALLLLDDVAAAEQVVEILPETRGCLVVATADGPLTGVPDVRPCTLGGLDGDAARTLLARRSGGEIRITVDPRAAERLAELCGHLPAALTLAAGWLAAHPQSSVLDAARAMEAREESGPLPRAFHLLLDSLPPTPARMLRLLPLAPGGLVDAHTASALAGCSVPAARAAVEEFAATGLLRPLGDGTFEVPGCLDPLLRAELERAEKPADILLAGARMLERTVRLLHNCRAATEPPESEDRRALAAEPKAMRFDTAEAARRWLDGRLPALLAAARQVVADGDLDTLARRYLAALARALEAHRQPEEAAPERYRLHELVLDVAERRGLHREKAAALLNLGDLDAGCGRLPEALARYRAALEAARADGEGWHEAAVRAMDSMGCAYAELEDWQRAADWFDRALALAQTRDDVGVTTRLYGRLGAVRMYSGQWAQALGAWRAAVAGHRRLRDPQGCARALGELARVQEYAGRPEDSLRTCYDALDWAVRAGDGRLRAALSLRLADTCDRLGEFTTAAAHRALADRLLAELDAEAAGERGGEPSGAAAGGASDTADSSGPSCDSRGSTYEIHGEIGKD